MPADKSADKLGSRMGVGERLEILCPVLFSNNAPCSKRLTYPSAAKSWGIFILLSNEISEWRNYYESRLQSGACVS